MKRTNHCTKIAVGIALASALVPGTAFASTEPLEAASMAASVEEAQTSVQEMPASIVLGLDEFITAQINDALEALDPANKLLSYDPEAIAEIGTQEETGHSICCPSFSCAYADAVLDGTIHDHSYYTCSCCTWTDWGGGDSSFRCVGSDEELLREAYDEISAGRPTVIHVSAGYGEHWIALIGYENATDPDHLTLDNFIALDPWDGAQINAASRFSLYGDGCEHISERSVDAATAQ